MICDLCANPAETRAIRLCPTCTRDAEADRRGTMARALARRRAIADGWLAARVRERTRARRAAGRCLHNGCRAQTAKSYCLLHMRLRAETVAAVKRRAAARGHCVTCVGRPAVPGRACCAVCRDRVAAVGRALRGRRSAEGLCPRCGEHPPTPGRANCARCRQREARLAAARRARRRAAGRCYMCGGPRDTAATRCTRCRAQQKAWRDEHR